MYHHAHQEAEQWTKMLGKSEKNAPVQPKTVYAG